MAGKRRGAYWAAMTIAAVLIAGGAVVAYLGYHATAGPSGAVKGYFAALQRADAATALAYGDLPAGPRELLTSRVLRAQQDIAPIENVVVGTVRRAGNTATVDVSYDVAFPGDRLSTHDTVNVVHRGHGWHLVRAAVPTRFVLDGAQDRASIVGAAVPTDTVLTFPGAAPIRLDSELIEIDPSSSVVTFTTNGDTDVRVAVTDAGRTAARAALVAAMQACLTGGAKADPRCPLPSPRAVPGSVAAALVPHALDKVDVSVGDDAQGILQMNGKARARGRYQLLTFDNVPTARSGSFTVTFRATAFVKAPLTLRWQQVSV